MAEGGRVPPSPSTALLIGTPTWEIGLLSAAFVCLKMIREELLSYPEPEKRSPPAGWIGVLTATWAALLAMPAAPSRLHCACWFTTPLCSLLLQGQQKQVLARRLLTFKQKQTCVCWCNTQTCIFCPVSLVSLTKKRWAWIQQRHTERWLFRVKVLGTACSF